MNRLLSRPVTRILAASAIGTVAVLSVYAVWRVSRSVELARRSEPYQQQPPSPLRSVLVVGDSTAVGTGASAAQHSVAGLIGRSHPEWAIENRGVDGARIADVRAQLQRSTHRYDVVLVLAGGNDVIRLTDMDRLRLDLESVARLARERAPQVVLVPCGNVGNAPFFFAPLSWWMTHRARRLHALAAAVAERTGVQYVKLFREHDEDPFVLDPALNASDGLHPSDAGYVQWWQSIRPQLIVGPANDT